MGKNHASQYANFGSLLTSGEYILLNLLSRSEKPASSLQFTRTSWLFRIIHKISPEHNKTIPHSIYPIQPQERYSISGLNESPSQHPCLIARINSSRPSFDGRRFNRTIHTRYLFNTEKKNTILFNCKLFSSFLLFCISNILFLHCKQLRCKMF